MNTLSLMRLLGLLGIAPTMTTASTPRKIKTKNSPTWAAAEQKRLRRRERNLRLVASGGLLRY